MFAAKNFPFKIRKGKSRQYDPVLVGLGDYKYNRAQK